MLLLGILWFWVLGISDLFPESDLTWAWRLALIWNMICLFVMLEGSWFYTYFDQTTSSGVTLTSECRLGLGVWWFSLDLGTGALIQDSFGYDFCFWLLGSLLAHPSGLVVFSVSSSDHTNLAWTRMAASCLYGSSLFSLSCILSCVLSPSFHTILFLVFSERGLSFLCFERRVMWLTVILSVYLFWYSDDLLFFSGSFWLMSLPYWLMSSYSEFLMYSPVYLIALSFSTLPSLLSLDVCL